MIYNSKKETYNLLIKHLIDFDAKMVNDKPCQLGVILSNDSLACSIQLDDRANKLTLGAYNRVTDHHHSDRMLLVKPSLLKEVKELIYNHIR